MYTSLLAAGATLSALSAYAQEPAGPGVLWDFPTDAAVFAAPSVASDGTVYVGTAGGTIYAISASGEELWKYNVQGSVTVSPLAASNGNVYVASLDGNLYALTSGGTLAWRFPTGLDNTSFLPAEGPDGKIYAGFHNRFYCLTSSGQEFWKTVNASYGLFPAIGSDGTIYHTGEKFVARASNGSPIWTFSLPSPGSFIESSPAIAPDGTVFALAANSGSGFSVHAIRPDGTEAWSFPSPEAFSSAPVLAQDNVIYLGTQDGSVYSLKTDGKINWKKTYDGMGSIAPVATTSGLLLVGVHSGRIMETAATGEVLSSTNLPGQLTPAAFGANGTVYVGSSRSNIHALSWAIRPATNTWSTAQANFQRNGRAPYAPSEPAAPGNVSASQGLYPAQVVVTWSHSANAHSYEVWRNSGEAVETAQMIGVVSGKNYFLDYGAPSGPSFYWVRAINSASSSAYSSSTTGFPSSGGAAGSWQFLAAGPFWYSSPALGTNGEVYIQSSGPGVTSGSPTSKGRLYAFDKEGQVLWSASTGQFGNSSPAVASDGTIYVGTGFDSYDSSGAQNVMGYLYAFAPGGSLKWKYPVSQQVMNSPALGADGTIYVGTLDYHIHAISPAGERKWIHNTGGAVADALALSADGFIYARSGEYLHAVDTNGVLKWQLRGGGGFTSPAIGSDGTLYSGAAGTFYALNPDGTVQWWFDAGSGVTSGAATGTDGSIYFATSNGRIYALSREGAKRWSFETGATIVSTPAVRADGSICFGALDGKMYILNADGTLASRLFVNGPISSSPAIDQNGRIYFGGEDRRMYALAAGIPPAASSWPMFGGSPTHSFRDPTSFAPGTPTHVTAVPTDNGIQLNWNTNGIVTFEIWRAEVDSLSNAIRIAQFVIPNSFHDLSAAAGTRFFYWIKARNSKGVSDFSDVTSATRPLPPAGGIIWSHLTDQGMAIYAAPAIGEDGTIYVGTTQTNIQVPLQHYLYAFKPNGTLKWRAPVGGTLISSPAIASDGSIYVGSTDFGVYAFDASGNRKWRFQGGFNPQRPFGAFGSSPAIGPDGTIYIGATDNRLYAVAPDGTLKWAYATAQDSTLSPVNASPALSAEGVIYFSAAAQLFAVNTNGVLLWSYRATKPFESSPALGTDGTIYIGNEDGNVHAIHPDGTRKWIFPTGAPANGSTPIVGLDETIFFASASSNLFAITTSGELKWKFSAAGAMTTTPAQAADGTIYAGSTNGVFYAVTAGGEERWAVATSGGVVAPPAIGSNGVVYFGTTDGQFYFVRGETPPAAAAWPLFRHDPRHTGLSHVVASTPLPPANVQASDGSALGRTRIEWNSADWAVSYDILRSATTNINSALILATNIAGTVVYDDLTAEFGTTYYYWVRASNGKGTSDWSRYDSGYQDTKRWEFNVDSPIRSSPAIDPHGNILLTLFGTFDNQSNVFRGEVLCLNTNGETKWTFKTGSAIRASPTIGLDGTVYIAAEDRKLYAISSAGTKKWEATLGRPAVNAAAIGQNGVIYVTTPTPDPRIYAFTPDGKKLWDRLTRATGESPTIAADGTIYVPTADQTVLALSVDGQVKWTFRGVSQMRSSAVLAQDGTIYIGEDLRFTAINTNGTLKWALPGIRGGIGAPIVGADGTIYLSTADSKFYAIRPDGTVRWQINPNPFTRSSAAISADGKIYLSTVQGILQVISTEGEILESLSAGIAESSPAIDASGILYVGSVSNKLYALQIGSPLANSSWPMLQRNARHSGADDSLPQLRFPDLNGNDTLHMTVHPGAFTNLLIERSEDLSSWTILTNVIGLTNQTLIIDPALHPQRRFYRMKTE